MDYAPWARIILRYLVGATFMGSESIGAQLSANPDLVMIVAAGIGLAVEAFYVAARRYGWNK